MAERLTDVVPQVFGRELCRSQVLFRVDPDNDAQLFRIALEYFSDTMRPESVFLPWGLGRQPLFLDPETPTYIDPRDEIGIRLGKPFADQAGVYSMPHIPFSGLARRCARAIGTEKELPLPPYGGIKLFSVRVDRIGDTPEQRHYAEPTFFDVAGSTIEDELDRKLAGGITSMLARTAAAKDVRNSIGKIVSDILRY